MIGLTNIQEHKKYQKKPYSNEAQNRTLTHKYIWGKTTQPICEECKSLLTIEHIIEQKLFILCR